MSKYKLVDYTEWDEAGRDDDEDVEVVGVMTSEERQDCAEVCYVETFEEYQRSSQACVQNGMEMYKSDCIADYNRKVLSVAADGMIYRNIESNAGLAALNTTWMNDPVVCNGVREMLNVTRVMMNLFSFCKVDVLGITQYIQLVMSKFTDILPLCCKFTSHRRHHIYSVAVYFLTTRYHEPGNYVCADIDVAVIEKIAKSATEEEVEAFRVKFPKTFCRSSNPYQMDSKDDKAEFKAFFVMLSLIAIELDSKNMEEPEDAIPFLKACMKSSYFGKTSRALAGIYFGVATNTVSYLAGTLYQRYIVHSHYTTLQVVSDVAIFVKSRRNEKTFESKVLPRIFLSKSTTGIRSLQFLSAIICFQIVSFTFVEKEDSMLASLQVAVDHCKQMNVRCGMNPVFQHYRHKVLDQFFDKATDQNKKAAQFQTSFGYTLFAKYLVHFCGQLFVAHHDGREGSKIQNQQSAKKRKAAPPAKKVEAKKPPATKRKAVAPVTAVDNKSQFVDKDSFEANVSNCHEFAIGGMITNLFLLKSILMPLFLKRCVYIFERTFCLCLFVVHII